MAHLNIPVEEFFSKKITNKIIQQIQVRHTSPAPDSKDVCCLLGISTN